MRAPVARKAGTTTALPRSNPDRCRGPASYTSRCRAVSTMIAEPLTNIQHRNSKRSFCRRRASGEERQHREQHTQTCTTTQRREPQRRADDRTHERRHVHYIERRRWQHVHRAQEDEQALDDTIGPRPQRRPKAGDRFQHETQHEQRHDDERGERHGNEVSQRCEPCHLRQNDRADRQHPDEQDELRADEIAQRRQSPRARIGREAGQQHRDGAE